MEHLLWRRLIIKVIIALCMIAPLQAMFYRAASKANPMRSASSWQKSVTQRIQTPQQGASIQRKFMLPKKQRFNLKPSVSTSKKSWSGLLAALGLGWLWNNEEDEEKQERTVVKHMSFDQFIKNFTPPQEIQETIEAHKDELSPNRIKPYLIKGTQPPVYHKWDAIDRIINAELLKEVITQNNLDIEIPQKYIYPNPNNGKYEVFAQGVPVRPLSTEQLTLKEIQALIKLTVESGYTDFNKDNVFRNPHNNKLIIIDTDNDSFLTSLEDSPTGYQLVNVPKGIGVRSAIDRLNRNFKINRDAQTWAINYCKELEGSEQGKERPNLYTSSYNTLNISAENAKELGRELRKQKP